MTGLRVLHTGFPCLLQDAGRYGWQHLGVSPSGPLDWHAAAWANHLLGNAWGAPLLEVALGDFHLQAGVDTWIAVCGADVPIAVDDVPQPGWSRFPVYAGQHVRLGLARSGQRAYLAVAGGLVAQPVLGSLATQVREGLGGLDGKGRALQRDDVLVCAVASLKGKASVPWPYIPDYRRLSELRVIPGADMEGFADGEIERFFSCKWRLSPQSDRMGARLLGEPLTAPKRQWSLGVTTGAIQVPPDGQPIILLADRQTMGGYPLLGWLHPLDVWRLAQCPAHRELNFIKTELESAQEDLRRFYRFFR